MKGWSRLKPRSGTQEVILPPRPMALQSAQLAQPQQAGQRFADVMEPDDIPRTQQPIALKIQDIKADTHTAKRHTIVPPLSTLRRSPRSRWAVWSARLGAVYKHTATRSVAVIGSIAAAGLHTLRPHHTRGIYSVGSASQTDWKPRPVSLAIAAALAVGVVVTTIAIRTLPTAPTVEPPITSAKQASSTHPAQPAATPPAVDTGSTLADSNSSVTTAVASSSLATTHFCMAAPQTSAQASQPAATPSSTTPPPTPDATSAASTETPSVSTDSAAPTDPAAIQISSSDPSQPPVTDPVVLPTLDPSTVSVPSPTQLTQL